MTACHLRKGLLTLAATTVGLTAGVMFCYQVAIMPGLGRLPDREFIAAFQSIDRSIVNPLFLVGTFLGGALWLVAATAVHRRSPHRFRRLAAASAGYLIGVVGLTLAGHVPMNQRLAEFPASSTEAQAAVARSEFEGPWNELHAVRTGAAVISLVLVCLAMVAPDETPTS